MVAHWTLALMDLISGAIGLRWSLLQILFGSEVLDRTVVRYNTGYSDSVCDGIFTLETSLGALKAVQF